MKPPLTLEQQLATVDDFAIQMKARLQNQIARGKYPQTWINSDILDLFNHALRATDNVREQLLLGPHKNDDALIRHCVDAANLFMMVADQASRQSREVEIAQVALAGTNGKRSALTGLLEEALVCENYTLIEHLRFWPYYFTLNWEPVDAFLGKYHRQAGCGCPFVGSGLPEPCDSREPTPITPITTDDEEHPF